MLFNSYIYILFFLPLSVLGFYILGRHTQKVYSYVWLVACSLFFYGYWNPVYLYLIVLSLVFNYFVGRLISKLSNASKKRTMIIGVVLNLGLLAYFKYFNFFVDNLNSFTGSTFSIEQIILPLAISFFTFQQIAYLVDAYEGKTHEYSTLHYFLFITFFPQLIAGPIVHHKELMPQFEKSNLHILNKNNITLGIIIFSLGLFKKVVLADTFAIWANQGFSDVGGLDTLTAWATSLSYTFQLYFDFSGYSEMAIGSALLFNIKLPVNFNSPYRALSIQEFWRRWHITLSTFLRDYLYFRMGGNRKGEVRTYFNLLMTMVLGGLWHGAGWQFIIWGFLHGMGLTINRFWTGLGWFKLPKLLSWFITFNFVNISWVFFRANSIDDSFNFLNKMFTVDHVNGLNSLWLISLIIGFFIIIFPKNVKYIYKQVKPVLDVKLSFGLAIIFFVCFLVLEIGRSSEFLYFQF